MEDELLNGGQENGQEQDPVVTDPVVTDPVVTDPADEEASEEDDVFVPSPEEAGYPVTKLGFIANMEAHTDAKQKKSDAAANMHAATALTMDVLEATVLRGASLLLRVNTTPVIANCPKLTWISSNEEVAVVDDMLKGNGIKEDGLAQLFARGEGEATITAISGTGLSCSMDIEVVAEILPEPIEVGSKYTFISYDAEGVTEYAQGVVEVLSSSATKHVAKVKVLSQEPDDPESPWTGREFFVDDDIVVGDGQKHPLYSDNKKTVVPGVSVAIIEEVVDEAGE